MNGKGMVPEKGRNLSAYRDGFDLINWKKKAVKKPLSRRAGSLFPDYVRIVDYPRPTRVLAP